MRVPRDFNWPLNVIWGGYLNPYFTQSTKCPTCEGTGCSAEVIRLNKEWHGNAWFDPVAYGARHVPMTARDESIIAAARKRQGDSSGESLLREAERLCMRFSGQWCHNLIQADVDALVEADRLWNFTRVARNEEQAAELRATGRHWLKSQNGYIPTADEVNAWSITGIGHDSINQNVCVRARAAREGIEQLGCGSCVGKGRLWPSSSIEAAYAAWSETEPPVGDGYQLWETTTEGSPISPVFSSLDELCVWCETFATTFGNQTTTAENWRKGLECDLADREQLAQGAEVSVS